jgi:hypothetical protein
MGKYVGALFSIVVAAGIVIGVIWGVGYYSRPLPVMTASAAPADASGLNHVTLNLAAFPFSPYQDPDWVNAHKDDFGALLPQPGDNQAWVTYWPTTNLKVPAHSLVTVTINNYDSATPLLNSYYAVPRGVVGNSISVDGKPVTAADPNKVSHTFTIHSIVSSSQPWLFVSVPLTAVASDAKADAAGMPNQPVVTTFSFVTPDKPGDYIWQCFDPCGSGFDGFGGPMSTKGYMSGTLTVTA